jgi:allophanate hydrolase subunit 1
MKFFIPHAKDEEQKEHFYEAIRKFAKEQLLWDITDRRIFSIHYRHDGKDGYAEVGKREQLGGMEGEEVIAILESNAYLICTPNRGFLRGIPILVGKEEAYSVVDFDK